MLYSEATPLGKTHILTVLTHLWFAAEIAPGGGTKNALGRL